MAIMAVAIFNTNMTLIVSLKRAIISLVSGGEIGSVGLASRGLWLILRCDSEGWPFRTLGVAPWPGGWGHDFWRSSLKTPKMFSSGIGLCSSSPAGSRWFKHPGPYCLYLTYIINTVKLTNSLILNQSIGQLSNSVCQISISVHLFIRFAFFLRHPTI